MEQEQAALIITEARSFSLYGGEGEGGSLCRRHHRLESHLFEQLLKPCPLLLGVGGNQGAEDKDESKAGLQVMSALLSSHSRSFTI